MSILDKDSAMEDHWSDNPRFNIHIKEKHMTGEDEEFIRIEREAAMRNAAAAPPAPVQEPVLYQFRWTNPSGDNHPESMMEWKLVEPTWNQTVEQKYAELAAYRYGGKPVYEVRALYAAPPAQRTWVSLTNQERENVIGNSMTPACVVLATEAKLKEKNT
jgi:hypothetical protein